MIAKSVSNLFLFALREKVKMLQISGQGQEIKAEGLLDDGEKISWKLSDKPAGSFAAELRSALSLAPDELVSRRYFHFQEGRINLAFYLSLFPEPRGERFSFSFIPKDAKAQRLEKLGFQAAERRRLRQALEKKKGLIVISSPHGQGKNTTLYSLAKEIDQDDRIIYFIGHPVISSFGNVCFLPAGKNSWDKVLRADPDVIVSTIETAADWEQAIRAATSGRLVLASYEAESAWETMSAFLKLKLPLKLKLDALKIISNQRLLPLKRPKKTMNLIGAFEVLAITPAMKEFLLAAESGKKEKFWERLGQLALSEGYEALSADIQKKRQAGII